MAKAPTKKTAPKPQPAATATEPNTSKPDTSERARVLSMGQKKDD